MTKKYYAPNKALVVSKPSEPQPSPQCEIVRFVLKSAQHLDLQLDTVEEVSDEIGGEMCMCIAACKSSGERILLPWSNVDYLEEIESC